MLPAAAGGPSAGQLTLGYFRTVNGITDPNSTAGKWTYSTAQSSNANAASPDFAYNDVNPGVVYHNGEVCNAGILCGTTPNGPSDRSLLDFTSAAIDSDGCPVYTFAGNPTGSPGNNTGANTFNYVTRQTSDCFSSSSGGSGGSGGPGSGGSGGLPEPFGTSSGDELPTACSRSVTAGSRRSASWPSP